MDEAFYFLTLFPELYECAKVHNSRDLSFHHVSYCILSEYFLDLLSFFGALRKNYLLVSGVQVKDLHFQFFTHELLKGQEYFGGVPVFYLGIMLLGKLGNGKECGNTQHLGKQASLV